MAAQNSPLRPGLRGKLSQTRHWFAVRGKTVAGVTLALAFIFILDQMYYRATARDPMLVTAERYVGSEEEDEPFAERYSSLRAELEAGFGEDAPSATVVRERFSGVVDDQ